MVDQKITILYNNSIVTKRSHSMSKKHFELLARNICHIEDPVARRCAAVAVASACHQSNPRFDWGRFIKACKAE
jgi:hypothetical protein